MTMAPAPVPPCTGSRLAASSVNVTVRPPLAALWLRVGVLEYVAYSLAAHYSWLGRLVCSLTCRWPLLTMTAAG